MTSYPDADWITRHEAATEAARVYAEREGLPGGQRLYELAMSAGQRTSPTSKDLTNQDWTAFYPRPDDDRGAADWDAAEANRRQTNQMYHDLMARNAQAKANREKAHLQELVAQKQTELDTLTDELHRGYLSTPGGTDQTFAAALPELLEGHRRRLLADRETADDIARRDHDASFPI